MRKIYGNIPTGAALRHQPNMVSTFPHNIIKTTGLQSNLIHDKKLNLSSIDTHLNTSLIGRLDLSTLNSLKQNHSRSRGL